MKRSYEQHFRRGGIVSCRKDEIMAIKAGNPPLLVGVIV
jgi:hypothetical protein